MHRDGSDEIGKDAMAFRRFPASLNGENDLPCHGDSIFFVL